MVVQSDSPAGFCTPRRYDAADPKRLWLAAGEIGLGARSSRAEDLVACDPSSPNPGPRGRARYLVSCMGSACGGQHLSDGGAYRQQMSAGDLAFGDAADGIAARRHSLGVDDLAMPWRCGTWPSLLRTPAAVTRLEPYLHGYAGPRGDFPTGGRYAGAARLTWLPSSGDERRT